MKSNDALYMVIYNHLSENIKAHLYDDGGRLPTEMELAKQFYVSRITSKKALNALAEEGTIIRIPGRGSFVKSSSNVYSAQKAIEPSKNIALVMGGYSSSFGLDIVNGAMDAADHLGLNLILKATYSSQEKEAQEITSLMASGVSGIIVQPSQGELYSQTLLKAVFDGFPIVMIDRNMQGIDAPFIGIDNVNLSKYAVNKLLESNHRNIALIALNDESSSTIRERMDGCVSAFLDKLLVVDRGLWLTRLNDKLTQRGLVPEDATAYAAYVEEIARHLEAHPEITAIFGTEYCVSKAAHDAARLIGKSIPEDISLVSFDMDSSYLGSHKMSYIKQPQREMGIRSCEIIKDLLEHKKVEQQHCILSGEWVEGNSIKTI